VVTFLFTDIEGSTRRWEADADAMRAALLEHDEVLRDAIESHGGFLFSHTGDGVVAAFASPKSAADAAITAQRALEAVATVFRKGAGFRLGLEHTKRRSVAVRFASRGNYNSDDRLYPLDSDHERREHNRGESLCHSGRCLHADPVWDRATRVGRPAAGPLGSVGRQPRAPTGPVAGQRRRPVRAPGRVGRSGRLCLDGGRQ
jgi:hypothetical protein